MRDRRLRGLLGPVGASDQLERPAGLRSKKRTTSHYNLLDLGPALLLAVASVGILALGLDTCMPLLIGLAPVGVAVGCLDLGYWLRPPRERQHWLYQRWPG